MMENKKFEVVIHQVKGKVGGEDVDLTVRVRLKTLGTGENITFSSEDNTSERICNAALAMLALADYLGLKIEPAAASEEVAWGQIGRLRKSGGLEVPEENTRVCFWEISKSDLPMIALKSGAKASAILRANVRRVERPEGINEKEIRELVGSQLVSEPTRKTLRVELPASSPEESAAYAAAVKKAAAEAVSGKFRLTKNESVVHEDGTGFVRMVWVLPTPVKPVRYNNRKDC